MGRAGQAVALLLPATLLAALLLAGAAEAKPRKQDQPPPNVIVFNTDDQPAEAFSRRFMPRTYKRIVDPGTEFDDFVVSTPLCCPSRAVLATGQYGHNNNVLRNSYNKLAWKRNVLPRWLQRAGYKTIHVGRFFNGYEGQGRELEVAPGWDIWRTALAPRRYYDYELTLNKGERHYGSADRAHLTGVLGRIAARLVAQRAPRARPFFLQFDLFGPHVGRGIEGERCDRAGVPAPEDEGAYLNEPLPMGPSFNEADVSDKPAFMQELKLLGPSAHAENERRWRCALASVQSVDRTVEQVVRSLRRAGGLRETALVFTSDNGYFFGQHRIDLRKHYPYEEAIRVPFALRLPKGIAPKPPARSGAPVANIDIVPTILELSGAEPCLRKGCRTIDGRSLLGEAVGEPDIPRDRAILLAYDQENPRDGLVCSYEGLRTPDDVFVSHSMTRLSEQGSCEPTLAGEHYLRASDPDQLQNLFPAPGGSELLSRQAALFTRLTELNSCAGISGRDPLPPSGHHCE